MGSAIVNKEKAFRFFESIFSCLQLLNQFENTGPPPADRDKIKSLPTVQVTHEHVGKYISPSFLYLEYAST